MLHLRVLDVKVSVSFWFAALFAGLYAVGDAEKALVFFYAAALHELGHVAMMLLSGDRVSEVGFYLGRIEIKRRESEPLGDKSLLLIYLGGILSNLISAAVCFSLGGRALAVCNLMLAAFNLAPCRFFDGGRCLSLALRMKGIDSGAAARVEEAASFAAGFALSAAGVLVLTGGTAYIPFSMALIFTGFRGCFSDCDCP